MENIKITVQSVKIKQSFKGLTGHWSKWGGARRDVYSGEGGTKLLEEEWFCQTCGEKQPKELPPYLYLYNLEYIRVCAVCFANHCQELFARLS